MKSTETKELKDEDSNTLAVRGRFKIIDKIPEDATMYNLDDLKRLSSQSLSQLENRSEKNWQEKVLSSRDESCKSK